MPAYTSRPKNFQQYTQMLEESHQRLGMMESHLKELVKTQKMADARVYTDEHRNITGVQVQILIGGAQVNALVYTVPQGEAWTVERLSGNSPDATATAFLAYRDQVLPSRLSAVVAPVIATGVANYYLSGTHLIYLPERTQLIVVAADGAAYSAVAFDGNIQVRVRKRHQNKISSEEGFALAGDYEEKAQPPGGIEDDYEDNGGPALEPHDVRHGDPNPAAGDLTTPGDDTEWTGDIAPPTPEQLPARPRPNWPQRIERAVEELVEEGSEFIEKVL